MKPSFDLIAEAEGWPAEHDLVPLCTVAIQAVSQELSLENESRFCLLFTDNSVMRELNQRFRDRPTPTNVLSFPAQIDDDGYLGDIALGQETVFREAQEKSIPVAHHIAHLVVHGFLHLQGYDHQTEAEAEQMEAIERKALLRMDIADPYQGDPQ